MHKMPRWFQQRTTPGNASWNVTNLHINMGVAEVASAITLEKDNRPSCFVTSDTAFADSLELRGSRWPPLSLDAWNRRKRRDVQRDECDGSAMMAR
jgi:hypothetical protein